MIDKKYLQLGSYTYIIYREGSSCTCMIGLETMGASGYRPRDSRGTRWCSPPPIVPLALLKEYGGTVASDKSPYFFRHFPLGGYPFPSKGTTFPKIFPPKISIISQTSLSSQKPSSPKFHLSEKKKIPNGLHFKSHFPLGGGV